METEKSLVKEIEVNTVISGLYAGERITKDIYGYHIGDILLNREAYKKIEKTNLKSPSTSKSSKGLARAKILFGTFIVPGANFLLSDSVKKDLENAVVFARITWRDDQTSEVFMQEVIFKELTGRKDVFDLAQDASAHIHDIGKNAIDRLKMNNSRPLYAEEYGKEGFNLPSVIKIVDKAAARANNQFLNGAVGWCEKIDNLETMSIFSSFVKSSGITFTPSAQSNAIYYRNPHAPDQYIMVDELFKEVQESRAAELEQVASKLGATYFKVEMVDSSVMKSNKERKASNEANAFYIVKAGSNSSYTEDSLNQMGHSIVAESHFSEKRDPAAPELSWFAQNQKIKSIIEMRLGEGGDKLQSHSINIKCSNYSVMNSETAGNLDAVIKKIGGKTKANMKKHVEQERNQNLIFYMEF